MVLLITEHEIAELFTVDDVFNAMEETFLLDGTGELIAPTSFNMWNPSPVGPSAFMRLAPAVAPKLGYAAARFRFGEQIFTLARIKPSELLLIMMSHTVEKLATAAVTAVGVKYLAPAETPVIGIYGTGGMSPGHLLAICRVRDIELAKVYSPNADHVREYCETMRDLVPCRVEPATPEEVARGSQIVITVTASKDPVFKDEWLEEGVLVCSAGSLYGRVDLDERTVRRSKIVLEHTEDTFAAQADFAGVDAFMRGSDHRQAQMLTPSSIHADLGEVVAGLRPGREGKETIWFRNEGSVHKGFAVAVKGYELARAKGLGKEIDLGDPSFPGAWGWGH